MWFSFVIVNDFLLRRAKVMNFVTFYSNRIEVFWPNLRNYCEYRDYPRKCKFFTNGGADKTFTLRSIFLCISTESK